jgi:ubiquinone/menaquinone biosynthesis C-methylase UbiE
MSGFDWRRHWAEHDENETAARFALKMADRLDEFLDWNGVSSFADYGCDPATMTLALAQRHPETSFYGFDFSDTLLAKNRVKAGDAELGNVAFEQATLPDIDVGRGFEAVTCFSSLHYVERIEEAIRSLFNVVKEGGWLLFNYPNIYTHWMYRRDIRQDDEEMKNRFRLVLNRRNIMTQRTIQRVTGVCPRKFHSAIRGNIYVALRKPRRYA